MSVDKKKILSRNWRNKLHEIIFEAETYWGKAFDITLLIAIVLSVLAVSWESLPNLDPRTKNILYIIEWIFTIFFTIEYILRLIAVQKPINYATSFYGIIDLLSIIPTYLSVIIVGSNSLLIIRALRLLRLFRIFKMVPYLNQGTILIRSLKSSLPKLTVFIYFVIVMVSIFGAIMYLVEGATNDQFDSIPRSIYWAIVTITTVGFGDIVPHSPLGQFLSAILMITGYAVIAIPTGIMSSEIIKEVNADNIHEVSTECCRYCSKEGHEADAEYCKYCGEQLDPEEEVK